MDHYIFLVAMMFSTVFILTCGHVDSKVCWDKKWYNNSTPYINGSEYETLSPTELDKICPNGAVIDAMCIDEKGEPFHGNKTDPSTRYIISCSVASGLVCLSIINAPNVCPDMAIKYGCECPTTPSSVTGFIPSAQGNQNIIVPSSTGSPVDPNQHQKQTGNGHNNGIKNEHSEACLLLVLLLVNSLY